MAECHAGPPGAHDDTSEDAEASQPSEGSLARGAKRAWPAAPVEGSSFSMGELRAKAEAELLKASANMANFRASANKTSKQYVAAAHCDPLHACLPQVSQQLGLTSGHLHGS